jgi:hypothetical protein
LPPWQWFLILIATLFLFALARFNHVEATGFRSRLAIQSFDAFAGSPPARTIYATQAFLLLLIFTFAMSACGGGKGSPASQATTYSLTVTAMSGGATRTAALTLIIQ